MIVRVKTKIQEGFLTDEFLMIFSASQKAYMISLWNSVLDCRIVEMFLTVDTSKKMQNGVNIDDSVDR